MSHPIRFAVSAAAFVVVGLIGGLSTPLLAGADDGSADIFQPASPERLFDSRVDGKPSADSVVLVELPSAVLHNMKVSAVALTLTVTEPDDDGYLTVYPYGGARPVTTALSYSAGDTSTSLTISTVGAGHVAIYTSASAHVIVDVVGYFGNR